MADLMNCGWKAINRGALKEMPLRWRRAGTGSGSDIVRPASRRTTTGISNETGCLTGGGAGIAPGSILVTGGGKNDFDQENGDQKSFFF
ncbi:MAG: hypothetical protein OXD45_00700 [Rhodobacteraceae bacterium]|nr:hypothetical protein [Paracoccaceae bacterium]